MKEIKATLFYLLNLCILLLLLLYFIDLNVYLDAISAASSFIATHLSVLSKKNVAIVGLFCYLILIMIDLNELTGGRGTDDSKNALYKRVLIFKPISGVVVYYLVTQGKIVRQGLLRTPVIKSLYMLRLLTLALLLLSGGLLFISFQDIYLMVFIALILITIIVHYLFEVAILTDVLLRVPDVSGSPYGKYFDAIQPLLAYSGYYVKEVKARKQ